MEWLVNMAFLFAGFIMGCKRNGSAQSETAERVKEVPRSINPLQVYREKKAREEEKRDMERLQVILENVESYDGTAAHQKDVPRS